ncbi:HAD-IA family hydrolase [Candidatus Dependentiae bacterium]|nr:HAD-IA family hydrolase [Candidatus Dependentiae bacterium]
MILWDVSGVLFKSDTWRLSFYEIGWSACAQYLLVDRKSIDHLKSILFDDLLFRLNPKETQEELARMPDGSKMSPMMMAWLKGEVNGPEMIRSLKALIEELDRKNYFYSKRERDLILKVIKVVFDPAIIARYTKPINKGAELLNESRANGNRNGIVSNWDSLSFDHLNNSPHGKSVFSLVEANDIFISGKCGLIKPNQKLFETILERCNVIPEKCFFIDDQPENIAAAAQSGIKGHCLGDGDYKRLKEVLIGHGYL